MKGWQHCAAFSFVRDADGRFTTTKNSHAFDLIDGLAVTACGLRLYAGKDCIEWATSSPTCKACARKLGC